MKQEFHPIGNKKICDLLALSDPLEREISLLIWKLVADELHREPHQLCPDWTSHETYHLNTSPFIGWDILANLKYELRLQYGMKVRIQVDDVPAFVPSSRYPRGFFSRFFGEVENNTERPFLMDWVLFVTRFTYNLIAEHEGWVKKGKTGVESLFPEVKQRMSSGLSVWTLLVAFLLFAGLFILFMPSITGNTSRIPSESDMQNRRLFMEWRHGRGGYQWKLHRLHDISERRVLLDEYENCVFVFSGSPKSLSNCEQTECFFSFYDERQCHIQNPQDTLFILDINGVFTRHSIPAGWVSTFSQHIRQDRRYRDFDAHQYMTDTLEILWDKIPLHKDEKTLTAEQFKQRWTDGGGELLEFSKENAEGLSIPTEEKAFLSLSGFPSDAAPGLSFGPGPTGGLPSAAEECGLPLEFSAYHVIGSTGSGNPICIDEYNNGIIVYLDANNGFESVFVNSSLSHLAKSILAFRDLVNETDRLNGGNAYLNRETPESVAKDTGERLRIIDGDAMKEGTFWSRELKELE